MAEKSSDEKVVGLLETIAEQQAAQTEVMQDMADMLANIFAMMPPR